MNSTGSGGVGSSKYGYHQYQGQNQGMTHQPVSVSSPVAAGSDGVKTSAEQARHDEVSSNLDEPSIQSVSSESDVVSETSTSSDDDDDEEFEFDESDMDTSEMQNQAESVLVKRYLDLDENALEVVEVERAARERSTTRVVDAQSNDEFEKYLTQQLAQYNGEIS